MKIIRQSNFELLRIVAMFMIVVHHYAIHGIRQSFNPEMSKIWLEGDSMHKIITSICMPGGTIGVGVFFLLTGFFMYGKKYKVQRLCKLLLQVYFYTFVLVAICVLLKQFQIYNFPELKLTYFDWIKNAVFPITSKSSGWFTQTYFVLFLFIPVLNKYIEKINTIYSICLLLFVWLTWYVGSSLLQSNYIELQRGVFFYLLGANIKRTNLKLNKTFACIVFIFMWILFVFIDIKITGNTSNITAFCLRQTRHLVCIPIAVVSLFCFFNALDVTYNKVINSIASTTFGIYLIHENLWGRPLVWNYIIQPLHNQYQSLYFPLLLIGTCVAVFCTLAVIDYCRIRFIEEKYMPYYNKKLDNLKKKIKNDQ